MMRFVPPIFFMTAMSACTPHLAPQPEHYANPVPAPTYTKHHTDDKPLGVRLSKGAWQLNHHNINKNNVLSNIDPKTKLSFSYHQATHQLNVSTLAGCNAIGIRLTIHDDGTIDTSKDIEYTTTQKSCGALLDTSENALSYFLQNTKKIHLDDDILTIEDKQGNQLRFDRTVAVSLDGVWALNDDEGFKNKPTEVVLHFNNGKGYANVGCNTINFSYQHHQKSLQIDGITSTKMACDNAFESEFLQFLQTPLTVWRQDDTKIPTLVLLNPQGKWLQLSFKP